jgi:cell division control protein 6
MAGREHGDARRAIDLLRVAGEIAEREQEEKVSEEHIRRASQKMEEDKETAALQSYPLHEKLIILAVMRAGGSSTGEIFTAYKELCRSIRQKELTQRRMTQMLSDIELSGIISGRIVHQGIHGRTKKFKLTISPETIKQTLKKDLILEDIV